MRDVAGQRANVGALGDGGGEGCAVLGSFDEVEIEDRGATRLQLDLFTSSGSLVGCLSTYLQRRIGWWDLLNLASEARQHGFDLFARRTNLTRRNDLPFRIQRVRFLAKADGEVVHLRRVQHLAAQLCGFAQSDRKDTARQRIEGAAVPDLRLRLARLPEDALDRAYRGR